MSKRPETLMLEDLLNKESRKKRLYGCEEITIGFFNNGHGNEIVDYMTMDSTGIIKCYELKVTLEDLKSSAKKSWYGHYNYLVTTYELWGKIKNNILDYIPKEVGVLVGSHDLNSVKKAAKQDISTEQEIMLKESMVRSMWWKMIKYKDAMDEEKVKKLNKRVREVEKEKQRVEENALKDRMIINDIENYYFLNTGKDIDLGTIAKEQKEIWRKKCDEERLERMRKSK